MVKTKSREDITKVQLSYGWRLNQKKTIKKYKNGKILRAGVLNPFEAGMVILPDSKMGAGTSLEEYDGIIEDLAGKFKNFALAKYGVFLQCVGNWYLPEVEISLISKNVSKSSLEKTLSIIQSTMEDHNQRVDTYDTKERTLRDLLKTGSLEDNWNFYHKQESFRW
jgi:hypothetical protein